MSKRRDYEMSAEQLSKLLDASKPVPMIALNVRTPDSPQARANQAWKKLGEEMGFDHMTVKPTGKGDRFFSAVPVEKQKLTGTVKWFNNATGYGFIIGDHDQSTDVFVHYRSIIAEGYKTLSEGQRVEYICTNSDKGLQAHEVAVVDAIPGDIVGAGIDDVDIQELHQRSV